MWKNTKNILQFKFLFLVALTPKTLINPLRQRLQELSLSSLRDQENDNYAAIILGDEEKIDGNLIFVKAPNGTKGERLKFAMKYLVKENIDYQYLCRFDDDDILNPSIFNFLSGAKAAVIADKYHSFFDLYTQKCLQTKRDWMANTVFLRKDCATHLMPDGRTLIEQDHAEEWMKFFKGKEIYFVPKKHPIYLRVLSPTSETANIDADNYQNYLESFGNWRNAKAIDDFKHQIKELQQISSSFFNAQHQTSSLNDLKGLFKKIKTKLFN